MELGHLVPFGDIGGDPDTVRDYAQGLEALGYDFLEAPDHVLGANVASPLPNFGLAAIPRVICSTTRSFCSAI